MSIVGLDTPDWLPGPQLGSGILVNNQGLSLPSSGTVNSSAFYVGQYSYLWVQVTQGGVNSIQTVPAFSARPNMSSPILFTTTYSSGAAAAVIPVMVVGQWCQIQFTNNQAGATTVDLTVLGFTNPPVAVGSAAVGPTIDVQGGSIAAAGVATDYPTTMVPGRYRLWTQSSQAGQVRVQYLLGSVWDFMLIAAEAANPGVTLEFYAPPSDWRVQVTNTGGASATYYLAVAGPY